VFRVEGFRLVAQGSDLTRVQGFRVQGLGSGVWCQGKRCLGLKGFKKVKRV